MISSFRLLESVYPMACIFLPQGSSSYLRPDLVRKLVLFLLVFPAIAFAQLAEGSVAAVGGGALDFSRRATSMSISRGGSTPSFSAATSMAMVKRMSPFSCSTKPIANSVF